MGFYVPIMWVEKGPFGAVLGLFWAIFAVFEGPKSPLASIRPGVPGNAIRGRLLVPL